MPKKSDHFSPTESWKNPDFLASPDARLLRIMAEYLEPAAMTIKEIISHFLFTALTFFQDAMLKERI